jgi:hypothetical protein
MAKVDDFPAVSDRLRDIFRSVENNLLVLRDAPGDYYANAPHSPKDRTEMFFGAVTIKKRYVSFYLMPVYVHPELLNAISQPLRKRMQGKSCFNFTSIDEKLITELTGLTQRGFEAFRQKGWA